MGKENTGTSVIRRLNVLDGRSGFQLRSKWGHVSVLEGGGHICELVLNASGGSNPLWRPSWKTIEPTAYKQAKHVQVYGPLPEGRLLSGIAGHSISFDYFGSPSPDEIAAGHSTHGEAPVVKWRRQTHRSLSPGRLVYSADLPHAQMQLQRAISLDHANPVVYCEETAVNLASFDRPISWNHHVTFGPPFLEANVTQFDTPATRSKVCPGSFSSNMSITPDADFEWPNAPTRDGGVLNLRTSQTGQYGHYTAHLLDPSLRTAFIAVCNPRLKLLVLYVFKRDDYPWVGNWEESYCRVHAPWNGREFCRGFEFSTTPFPVPRREAVAMGNLFGQSTYIWIAAKATATRRYIIALLTIGQDFTGVSTVEISGNLLRVTEKSGRNLNLNARAFM